MRASRLTGLTGEREEASKRMFDLQALAKCLEYVSRESPAENLGARCPQRTSSTDKGINHVFSNDIGCLLAGVLLAYHRMAYHRTALPFSTFLSDNHVGWKRDRFQGSVYWTALRNTAAVQFFGMTWILHRSQQQAGGCGISFSHVPHTFEDHCNMRMQVEHSSLLMFEQRLTIVCGL